MPTYLTTSDLLDRGTELFGLLGGFWSDYYGGEELVQSYAGARSESYLQTLQDIHETVACVDRASVPVYHRERWLPFTILRSDQLTDERLIYTEDDVLGDAANATFASQTYDWAYPEGFTDAAFAADKVNEPSIIWAPGVQFIVDNDRGAIRFQSNPFLTPEFVPTPVYDSLGNITDYELTIWLGQADSDRRFLANQFGYLLKLEMASSEQYSRLLNAICDAELPAASSETLDEVLSAACDSPLVKNDGEVVVAITEEIDRQLVLTDQAVYVCGTDANLLVGVGDTLQKGDRITNAFEVIALTNGTPVSSILPELTVPVEQLMGSFTGGLTWDNTLTPLLVTTVLGRTKVSWALGGTAGDVTLFFDTAHANGILPGNRTLAQLLDTRPQPQSTDPDVNSLPEQINPLEFLVDNVLAYGAVLIRLDEDSFGPNSLGTSILSRALRMIVPPQGVALIVD